MSPRSSEQLDELREQRRKEILEAALELFARQGFHNTSIEQIRKKAGVSKGLIYNYFTKKEDLVTAIIMGEMKSGENIMAELGRKTDPQERFQYVIDFAFEAMTRNLEHSKLVASLSLQLDLPEFSHLREMIVGRVVGFFPLAEHLIRELGFPNPDVEARALMALLDGLGIQYIMLGDVIDLDQMKQYLLDRYLSPTLPNECDDEAPEPQDSHGGTETITHQENPDQADN